MNRQLLAVAVSLSLLACGPSAAALDGAAWKIASWTYKVDSITTGTTTTKQATAENAGTLTFSLSAAPSSGIGKGTLTRAFTQVPQRGTSDASFFTGPSMSVVGWDVGGLKSEPDQLIIYDGGDASWNGSWKLTGGGGAVTLTRTSGVDFGGQQMLNETHIIKLTR